MDNTVSCSSRLKSLLCSEKEFENVSVVPQITYCNCKAAVSSLQVFPWAPSLGMLETINHEMGTTDRRNRLLTPDVQDTSLRYP